MDTPIMKPGNEVLALLRNQPSVAISAWGFIVRGDALRDAVGGACTLTCTRYNQSSIYRIDVVAGGPDWYIPFSQGEARYCDVPSGQPDGTLVVTYPMNGCALSVHATATGNRFFHDSDGNAMGGLVVGAQKIRVTNNDYSGPDNTTQERCRRYFGPDKDNTGGYEHTVICIKRGAYWHVYGSAIIRVNADAWQVKDRVPYALGQFDD
ncbi:hypothetical protein [Pseudomonas sp. NPDC089741]|uniref:hypothetical protein n=1 Tax=Pseudomonas sp. NPDC089741 TaxID=3364470 RepID=UPI00382E9F7C